MSIDIYSLDRDLRRAANREAAKSTFGTDIVVYGLLVTMVGCLSLLTGGFGLAPVSLAAGGSLVATVSWTFTYLRHRKHFVALYLKEWNTRLQFVRDEELVCLAARLEALGVNEGTAQLKQLKRGFETFRRVLRKKFNVTELTYQRYDLLVENLFLSVMDNFERSAERLEAVASFRQEDGSTSNPTDTRSAVEVLRSSAKALLTKNKAVLAALKKASVKMSKVQTRRGRARLELDAALEELSGMIENVHRYALDKI